MSIKDSLSNIMAIVTHFGFELHQMNVRTSLLNGDLVEDVYMSQPTSFEEVGKEHILKRLNMQSCSSAKAPIVKGDKFSKFQCPQNDIERDKMKAIPYYSIVGSLMYAQVCIRLDITFVVKVFGRYLSDPGQSHWKATKKVLRYLQGTKDLMLTYWCTDTLKVVGFSDSDYAGHVDDKRFTSCYIFMMD